MSNLLVMCCNPRMMNCYVFLRIFRISVTNNPNCSDDTRISGYFCSDTVFNLSQRVLSEDELKVFQKGLYFAPIQNNVNEPELRKDFD